MVYIHPLTVILIFLHVIYNQRPESSPTRAIGKKHQMNDVPDPPTTADVDVVCKQVIWSYCMVLVYREIFKEYCVGI